MVEGASFDRVPGWVVVAVLALAVVVWGPTIGYGYTLDDHGIVYANAMVERFDLRGIFTTHLRAGSTVEEEPDAADFLYRPLPLVTFAIDHRTGGGGPAAGHATSVLLHAVAAVLAWAVLRRLGTPVPVAAAATMFALLHPIHVESVANIKHREEILATIGVMGTWLCVEGVWSAVGSARVRVWSVLSGAAFLALAALLSKESAAFALAAIPLSSWMLFPREIRPWRRIVAIHLPLGVAFGAWLAIRAAVIGTVATVGNEIFFLPSEGFLTRLLTSAKVWWSWYAWRGVVLMTYPAGFSSRCEVRVEHDGPSLAACAGMTLVLLALVAVVVFWRGGRRDLGYWVVFFGIALLPTSNLVVPIGSVGAYRFLYLPSLAWGVLGGVAIVAVMRRLVPPARGAAGFWGVVVALACVLATASARECRNWRDDRALNASDLRRTSNPRARYVEAWASSTERERERWLRETVRIMEGVPGSAQGMETTLLAKTYTELGDIALDRSSPFEAEALGEKAMRVLEPDARFHRYRAFPLGVLARAALLRGDRATAIARWRASAAAQPLFGTAYRERARLEAEGGSPERAAAALREGIDALRAANRAWLREDLEGLEAALAALTSSERGRPRR